MRSEAWSPPVLQPLSHTGLSFTITHTHTHSTHTHTSRSTIVQQIRQSLHVCGNFSIRFSRQYVSLFAFIASIFFLLLTSVRKSSRWTTFAILAIKWERFMLGYYHKCVFYSVENQPFWKRFLQVVHLLRINVSLWLVLLNHKVQFPGLP